jgi:hypothetical protein
MTSTLLAAQVLARTSLQRLQTRAQALRPALGRGDGQGLKRVFRRIEADLAAPGVRLLGRLDVPAGTILKSGLAVPPLPGSRSRAWPVLTAEVPGHGTP